MVYNLLDSLITKKSCGVKIFMFDEYKNWDIDDLWPTRLFDDQKIICGVKIFMFDGYKNGDIYSL